MPSCVDSGNTTTIVKKKKKIEISTKENYFFFGGSLISQDSVESFKIKPKFNSDGEFLLLVKAKLKSGNSKTDKITVVSSEQVKEKFGICNETTWYRKGLNYDSARKDFLKTDFEGLLMYLEELLSNDYKNISWPLSHNCHVEAHAKKYLELVRETTDEEFEKLVKQKELMNKIRELVYAGEEDRERIYQEIIEPYKELYGIEPPEIDHLIKDYEWATHYVDELF